MQPPSSSLQSCLGYSQPPAKTPGKAPSKPSSVLFPDVGGVPDDSLSAKSPDMLEQTFRPGELTGHPLFPSAPPSIMRTSTPPTPPTTPALPRKGSSEICFSLPHSPNANGVEKFPMKAVGNTSPERTNVVAFTPNTSDHLSSTEQTRLKSIRAIQMSAQMRDRSLVDITTRISTLQFEAFNMQQIDEIAALANTCAYSIRCITQGQKCPSSEEMELLSSLDMLINYQARLQQNVQQPVYLQVYNNCRSNSKLLIATNQILRQVMIFANKFQKSRPVSPSSRAVSPAAGNLPTTSGNETITIPFIALQKKDIEEVLSVRYLFDQSLEIFNATFKASGTIEGKHVVAATNLAETCLVYLAKTGITTEEIIKITNIYDSCARLAAHLHSITNLNSPADTQYKAICTKHNNDYIRAVHSTIEELQLFQTTTSGLQSIRRSFNLLRLAFNSQDEAKKTIAHDTEAGVIGIRRIHDSNDGTVSYQQLYHQDVVDMVNELVTNSIVKPDAIVTKSATTTTTNQFMQLLPLVGAAPHIVEAAAITAAKIIATLFLFQNNFNQLLCFRNKDLKNKYMANLLPVFDMFLGKLRHIYPNIDFTIISNWIKRDKSGVLSFASDLVIDRNTPGVIAIGIRENDTWLGKKVEFHVSTDCRNRHISNMQDFTIMLVTEAKITIGNAIDESVDMIGLKDRRNYYYTGSIQRNSDGSIAPCPGGRLKYLNEDWHTVLSPDNASPSQMTDNTRLFGVRRIPRASAKNSGAPPPPEL